MKKRYDMKSKIITIVIAVCMLTCMLAACGTGPNGNGNTPSPTTGGGNTATGSPSPAGSPTVSPSGSPSTSPSDGNASPSPSENVDGSPSPGTSNNIYVGVVKSIDGDKIDLTSEGLDDTTAAGNDTKTKTITVNDSMPIVKQGVSTDAKIADIKKGDVLIVTMDQGKPVSIYDYGPLKE
jgi:hypothetical protein